MFGLLLDSGERFMKAHRTGFVNFVVFICVYTFNCAIFDCLVGRHTQNVFRNFIGREDRVRLDRAEVWVHGDLRAGLACRAAAETGGRDLVAPLVSVVLHLNGNDLVALLVDLVPDRVGEGRVPQCRDGRRERERVTLARFPGPRVRHRCWRARRGLWPRGALRSVELRRALVRVLAQAHLDFDPGCRVIVFLPTFRRFQSFSLFLGLAGSNLNHLWVRDFLLLSAAAIVYLVALRNAIDDMLDHFLLVLRVHSWHDVLQVRRALRGHQPAIRALVAYVVAAILHILVMAYARLNQARHAVLG